MGSSPPTPDAGFATPSAVVISLAVATLALAVQARAILAVHASEADYARISAEIRLDGAETLALAALSDSEGLARPRAVVELDGPAIDVVAEPEAPKLSVAAAGALPSDVLTALGARDGARVQQGLSRLAGQSVLPHDIAELDPSLRWQACGRTWISPFGGALQITPEPAYTRAVAHVGEVWRVIAHDASGWTEDRTLRITGEDHAPAHVIDRSLYRLASGEGPCRLATAASPLAPTRPATP